MHYAEAICWLLSIASGYALIAFLPPILIGENKMSTHASVGYEREDGIIVGIYVHFNGYLGGLGETLLSMPREKWVEIVDKGDCSCINDDFTAEHYIGRGEPWETVEPQLFQSERSFALEFSEAGCWHSYLLRRDGSKQYDNVYGVNDPCFTPLAAAIDRERIGN